jgi:tRNA nucleotidyltransferase (CCA-adding enzyme)
LAQLTARHHGLIHRAEELRAGTILDLIETADGLRRPERFEHMLIACEADYRGRTGHAERPYPQGDQLRQAADAVRAVDAGAIAGATPNPKLIPERLRSARIAAIKQIV